jgi:hypothetical protein
MSGSATPEPVKKTPILPGSPSRDDMVNDAVIPNKHDRSKQDYYRGKSRDYKGQDKYRHFDEEAARNPTGKK